jgi:voltage-gated potassium channel
MRMTTPAAANPPVPAAGARGRLLSGKVVLCAIVLLFVAAPFLDQVAYGDVIESVLLTLVLCSAVYAIDASRAMAFAIALAAPAVIGRWVHQLRPGLIPPEIFLAATVLAVAFIAFHFLRYVLTARRVDSDVLCIGASAFFLLALLWAVVYMLVDRAMPGSFVFTAGSDSARSMNGFTALYFSVVTLCTVGFGDIVPVSGAARMLAMFEGAAGVFFIAVILSRLVSLFAVERRRDAEGPPRA